MTRSSVVLPQPDGPMRETNSPRRDVEVDVRQRVHRAVGGLEGQRQPPRRDDRRLAERAWARWTRERQLAARVFSVNCSPHSSSSSLRRTQTAQPADAGASALEALTRKAAWICQRRFAPSTTKVRRSRLCTQLAVVRLPLALANGAEGPADAGHAGCGRAPDARILRVAPPRGSSAAARRRGQPHRVAARSAVRLERATAPWRPPGRAGARDEAAAAGLGPVILPSSHTTSPRDSVKRGRPVTSKPSKTL